MDSFEDQAIETATQLREQLGGTILAFPIEPENPHSHYAVVMYIAGRYFVYPEAANIAMASAGVLTILEECKKTGMDVNYERDVRIISYQAQIDAPDVTMRKLKKENSDRPFYESGKDFCTGNEETGDLVSARGVIKFSYLAMTEDKNPTATLFMGEYYKLLAMRKYGKTASAIRQEVHRMGKAQVVRWLEATYEKYVHDDTEVFNLLEGVVNHPGLKVRGL